MADEPNTQQSISDDQELAKVLAGVSQEVDNTTTPDDTTEVETTPVEESPAVDASASVTPPNDESDENAAVIATTDFTTPEVPTLQPISSTPAASGELDDVKKEALSELRPLVDKLNVSPEEKFDTYLLLLRSTDDKALIAPAHEAAKAISDEARRAQALLDIIKEIDFLSQNQQS